MHTPAAIPIPQTGLDPPSRPLPCRVCDRLRMGDTARLSRDLLMNNCHIGRKYIHHWVLDQDVAQDLGSSSAINLQSLCGINACGEMSHEQHTSSLGGVILVCCAPREWDAFC